MPVVPSQPTEPSADIHASAHAGASRADAPWPDVARVLAQAKAGSNEAWRHIVAHYAPRVFGLVYSRCRDRAKAEDITQGVLASVAIHVCDGRYDEQGKFEAWMFRVAMNRVRDFARAKARAGRLYGAGAASASIEDVEDHAPVAEPHEPDQRVVALRAALEQLSPQDREVIELRHHAGLSFQAMAEVLEEPLGTLLARHHRALHKLRTMLGDGPGVSDP